MSMDETGKRHGFLMVSLKLPEISENSRTSLSGSSIGRAPFGACQVSSANSTSGQSHTLVLGNNGEAQQQELTSEW